MPLFLPFRCGTALAAASTVGLSTALLAVTGTASAAPSTGFSVTTPGTTTIAVPATACGVEYTLVGAKGGDSAHGAGGFGRKITGNVWVGGTTIRVTVGGQGGSNGAGGTGVTGSSGGAGGAGAGGGGGASVLSDVFTSNGTEYLRPLVIAAGGGGAGSQAAGGAAGAAGSSFTSPNGHVYGGGASAVDAVDTGRPGGAVAGGTIEAGAPGTAGQAGGSGIAGAGPAGAGGGGGGFSGGGSGASDGTDGSGGGGGVSWTLPNSQPEDGDQTHSTLAPATEAAGSLSGTWVTCRPPHDYAYGEEAGGFETSVGDGQLAISWDNWMESGGDPTADKTTGWEITTDGGAHWAPTAVPVPYSPAAVQAGERASVTLTGLTNGHTYDVRVRPTSDVGPGEVSRSFLLTPQGAATPVPATSAPSAAPSTSVAPVPAPAAPKTLPAGNGALTRAAASMLAVGKPVTVSGSGYAPHATVDLYVYSTPQRLGSVVADANGAFTATVTVPVGLAPGTHHLVSVGADPSGAPRYLTATLTVADDGTTLAYTGFTALPWAAGGAGALVVGTGLLVAVRRRNA